MRPRRWHAGGVRPVDEDRHLPLLSDDRAPHVERIRPTSQPANPEPRPAPVDAGPPAARRGASTSVARRSARRESARPTRVSVASSSRCPTSHRPRRPGHGRKGEELLGRRLDTLGDVACGASTIAGSREPRPTSTTSPSRPSGVFVIDAKRYDGPPDAAGRGRHPAPADDPADGRLPRLHQARRGRAQAGRPRAGRARSGGSRRRPVRGMLCFVEADWPLFGGSFVIDGVDVLWPKRRSSG